MRHTPGSATFAMTHPTTDFMAGIMPRNYKTWARPRHENRFAGGLLLIASIRPTRADRRRALTFPAAAVARMFATLVITRSPCT
jgi:hypothetical protein